MPSSGLVRTFLISFALSGQTIAQYWLYGTSLVASLIAHHKEKLLSPNQLVKVSSFLAVFLFSIFALIG
jgi:predicted neutral ceramidase superfamily lipid hydrolase